MYEVGVENKGDYLEIIVSGERKEGEQLEAAKELWGYINTLSRKHKVRNLLVVLEIKGYVSAFSSYEVAAEGTDLGYDFSFKVALVDLNQDSQTSNKFAAQAAKDLGFNVRFFDAIGEAILWLKA